MPTMIIAGMHRSGTTLTAKTLYRSGLNLGDSFATSKFKHANPNGQHFEDIDFLRFHREVLRKNGVSTDGYITTETMQIPSALRAKAQKLIQEKMHLQQWGWKEPRTCLFLPLWTSVIPDPYLLIVYRPYLNVVDSLLRRKLDHPQIFRQLFYNIYYFNTPYYTNYFTQVWIRYNQELINNYQSNRSRSLIMDVRTFIKYTEKTIQFLNDNWGFTLSHENLSGIFQPNKLSPQPSYAKLDMLNEQTISNANQTAEELDRLRDETIAKIIP